MTILYVDLAFGAILILLKFLGLIIWSWWLVTLPIVVGLAVLGFTFIAVIFGMIIVGFLEKP